MVIEPRLLASYGALLAAATLGVLYLYRGRAFIVYWIGAWLLAASAAWLTARGYTDARLEHLISGVGLLFVVWASGLMILAAESFPAAALRWTTPLRVAAGTAVWFLASPFIVRIPIVLGTGLVTACGLLAWAAARYFELARRQRSSGALLIGVGLGLLFVANMAGAAAALGMIGDTTLLARVATINVVTIVFLSLGMHLLVFEDMTTELRRTNEHLEAANEEVRRLAITDPLTGCHNRRFFDEIERREMQRHRRYDAPLSVVFVDVNHFKQLNDTLGHEAGDDLLRTIGGLLRRRVRESDYVLRWGGDEFLLLLTCGAREAQAKANELKTVFLQERSTRALPPYVALSIGIAEVSKEADSLNDAIREADAAMYRDKLHENRLR